MMGGKVLSYLRRVEDDTIILMENEEKIFWMKEIEEDKEIKVELGGQLKTSLVHEFLDEAMAVISVDIGLILDFSLVTYISPSFMKAILFIQQRIDEKADLRLKLVNMSKEIFDEFEKTGFSELLDIE